MPKKSKRRKRDEFKPIDPRVRERPEYQQGRDAYTAGIEGTSSVGMERLAWWAGWLDARTFDRLGFDFSKPGSGRI